MAESPDNAASDHLRTPAHDPPPPPPPLSPPPKPEIPRRYDLDAKWDACLDLSIRRVAYSSLAGAFAGLLLFRSPTTRWASVALGAGVGIGAAYTECSYIFNGVPSKLSPKVSTVPFVHSEVIALMPSHLFLINVNFSDLLTLPNTWLFLLYLCIFVQVVYASMCYDYQIFVFKRYNLYPLFSRVKPSRHIHLSVRMKHFAAKLFTCSSQ